jgi:cell division protein FtsZ
MNSSTEPNPGPAQPDLTATPAPPPKNKPLVIRLVGVGGAGGNAVAHMAKTELRELRPLVLHTSARVLDTIEVPEKVLLGANLMHGLGAGGDPSLARAAAENDVALLKTFCQDVDLLFIVTGLGRGTGTGIAPVLARVAKEAGALVLGVATLPFDIEGPRRQRQAQQGLAELRAAADAVICLSNQKIFRVVDENTSVLEGLKLANELLAQGIRGLWTMLTRPGLIHVGLADLAAVLRDRHCESAFAAVEAQGEGRARDVIEQLLASPLLDGAQALAEADSVLVNLVGGTDLSMADVKRVMEEINRRVDNAQLVMGATVAPGYEGRLGLTLVASRRPSPEGASSDAAPRSFPAGQREPANAPESEDRFLNPAATECGPTRFTPQLPTINLEQREQLGGASSNGNGKSGRGSSRKPQQTQLPLQIVSKGRFEKSQPTIHRGEDLDVPTYVRRGIPLN